MNALKAELKHTWPVIFARHGNFTAVQTAAIPPILAGQDTLVIAATASGKTEAVVAPLLERLLRQKVRAGQLQILYLCPTRALVRDLYERLAPLAAALNIALAMKTGDTGPLSTTPTVLLTTPESTDSLLTRSPRRFVPLTAVILDEIHLFDNTPRGDHLRCLLARIERIRSYGCSAAPPLHRLALSATVPDPQGIAQRYLAPDAAIVELAGGRQILADMVAMYGLADLIMALSQRPSPKTLIFCNTRNEVEQTAAFLRQHLPYETAVFAHYSNLDKRLREEVEGDFAAASVAVCVATSTLELGIDIGSIDEVALVGPPPTLTSFLQRIGRGSRRSSEIRVLCLARSPLEEIRFATLLQMAETEMEDIASYHFLPSVLVQQSFSLLKQSPTGSLRFADLRRIAPADVDDETIQQILGYLVAEGVLQNGRLGEYLPGRELQTLFDNHEIYSNIGSPRLLATVIDAYSGKPLAQMERPRQKGETLLMGGRPMRVKWQDRYRVAIEQGSGEEVEELLRFVTAPFAVPLAEAQGIGRYLGVPTGQIPLLVDAEGVWLFHFWGGVYGELLTAVLEAHYPSSIHPATRSERRIYAPNDLCLRVPFPLTALPPWQPALAERAARRLSKRLTPLLELGRFHDYLPQEIALQTVVERVDIGRLATLYQQSRLIVTAANRSDLRALLSLE